MNKYHLKAFYNTEKNVWQVNAAILMGWTKRKQLSKRQFSSNVFIFLDHLYILAVKYLPLSVVNNNQFKSSTKMLQRK